MSHAIPQSLKVSQKPAASAVGPDWRVTSGKPLIVKSPIDGSVLAEIATATPRDVESVIREGQLRAVWRGGR